MIHDRQDHSEHGDRQLLALRWLLSDERCLATEEVNKEWILIIDGDLGGAQWVQMSSSALIKILKWWRCLTQCASFADFIVHRPGLQ